MSRILSDSSPTTLKGRVSHTLVNVHCNWIIRKQKYLLCIIRKNTTLTERSLPKDTKINTFYFYSSNLWIFILIFCVQNYLVPGVADIKLKQNGDCNQVNLESKIWCGSSYSLLQLDFEQPEQYGCLASIGYVGYDLNKLRVSKESSCIGLSKLSNFYYAWNHELLKISSLHVEVSRLIKNVSLFFYVLRGHSFMTLTRNNLHSSSYRQKWTILFKSPQTCD